MSPHHHHKNRLYLYSRGKEEQNTDSWTDHSWALPYLSSLNSWLPAIGWDSALCFKN